MSRPFLRLVLTAALLASPALVGCTPQIGNKCTSSTDCSLRGDRLCDTTQPGGYCTIFNCEPGTCPDEAQCVAFNNTIDPVCTDPRIPLRFQRTFCMKRCEKGGDCRNDYVCGNLTAGNPWNATVIDADPAGTAVCISPAIATPSSSGGSALCYPYDAGLPDVGYFVPEGGELVGDAQGDPELDASVDTPTDGAPDSEAADGTGGEPDSAADAPEGN